MKWFGENWGAPVCEESRHIAVPVGEVCGFCGEPIQAGDAGVEMPFAGDPTGRGCMDVHRACLFRSLFEPHSAPTKEPKTV